MDASVTEVSVAFIKRWMKGQMNPRDDNRNELNVIFEERQQG